VNRARGQGLCRLLGRTERPAYRAISLHLEASCDPVERGDCYRTATRCRRPTGKTRMSWLPDAAALRRGEGLPEVQGDRVV
jgi:hypothetical protein